MTIRIPYGYKDTFEKMILLYCSEKEQNKFMKKLSTGEK